MREPGATDQVNTLGSDTCSGETAMYDGRTVGCHSLGPKSDLLALIGATRWAPGFKLAVSVTRCSAHNKSPLPSDTLYTC